MTQRTHQIDHKVDQLLEAMQSDNIRITPQRRAILTFLISSPVHPSVEEIYQQVKKDNPKISLATVYNNVRAFVKAGIVQELNLDEKSKHYDLVYHHPHGHLICQQCGKIEDLEVGGLDQVYQQASQLNHFKVQSMELTFQGLCNHCQAKIDQENK